MVDGEIKVVYHETNEGRETSQGIAGFEGNNALWFILAVGLAILIFRQGSMFMSMPATMAAASCPIVLVSLYVFGLKQGKPNSYDIELFEWIVVKLSKQSYFGPKYTEPFDLEWVNVHRKPVSKSKGDDSDG